MSDHLNDPEINSLLDDLEDATDVIQDLRVDGDYASISFQVGRIAGTCSRIYQRNNEIDHPNNVTGGLNIEGGEPG